jgi:hypothetical protein
MLRERITLLEKKPKYLTHYVTDKVCNVCKKPVSTHHRMTPEHQKRSEQPQHHPTLRTCTECNKKVCSDCSWEIRKRIFCHYCTVYYCKLDGAFLSAQGFEKGPIAECPRCGRPFCIDCEAVIRTKCKFCTTVKDLPICQSCGFDENLERCEICDTTICSRHRREVYLNEEARKQGHSTTLCPNCDIYSPHQSNPPKKT